MNCVRCRKPIEADGFIVRTYPRRERDYLLDGDVICTDAGYHTKCLPPQLFHKLAGSLPAAQSPAAASLRNEHVSGGGLKRKSRKRPSRRKRYRATAQRHKQEEETRDKRRAERTEAMTAEEQFAPRERLLLCHCLVFSKDWNHYRGVTKHGYCKYCGGWDYRPFRRVAGEAKLQEAIAELDLHYRTEMQRIIQSDESLEGARERVEAEAEVRQEEFRKQYGLLPRPSR